MPEQKFAILQGHRAVWDEQSRITATPASGHVISQMEAVARGGSAGNVVAWGAFAAVGSQANGGGSKAQGASIEENYRERTAFSFNQRAVHHG